MHTELQNDKTDRVINNKFHFFIIALVVIASLTAAVIIVCFSVFTPGQSDKKSMRAVNWWLNDNTVSTIESNYNKSYKSAKLALNEKLYTGHQIYLDEGGKPFIISGGTKIYLVDSGNGLDIPESEKGVVRGEGTGRRIIIYKNKQEFVSAEQQSESYRRLVHNSAALEKMTAAVNGRISENEIDIKTKNIFGLGKQKYIPVQWLFSETGGSYEADAEKVVFSVRTAAGVKTVNMPIGKVWTDEETGRRFAPVKKIGNDYYIALNVLNHKFGYDVQYNKDKKLLIVITDTADIAENALYAPKKIDLKAGKSVYKDSSVEFKVPDTNKFILPRAKENSVTDDGE